MWWIIEKDNPLAVHGIFDTEARAWEFLRETVPEYCRRGFYSDKTLTPDSFTVVPARTAR
jgi:hypothetical protein